MNPAIGFAVWAIFLVSWCAIRYPAMRRSRKTKTVRDSRDPTDIALLVVTTVAFAVLPVTWKVSGWPRFADHGFTTWAFALGILSGAGFLWLFHRSHHDLGRNWSVSLEIRQDHQLVMTGVYSRIRHPMYSSFMLWGLMQAFLISNWIAGLAGMAAIIALYVTRYPREEKMMVETFGEQYEEYRRRTARLIPGIY
jgi:protein-S-isoprenylcysteine O-methyltransferase Ste14